MAGVDTVRADLNLQKQDIAHPTLNPNGSPGTVTLTEARGVVERARSRGVSDAEIRDAFSSMTDRNGSLNRYLGALGIAAPPPPAPQIHLTRADRPSVVPGFSNGLSNLTSGNTSVSSNGDGSYSIGPRRGSPEGTYETRQESFYGAMFLMLGRNASTPMADTPKNRAIIDQMVRDNPSLATARAQYVVNGTAQTFSLADRPAFNP